MENLQNYYLPVPLWDGMKLEWVPCNLSISYLSKPGEEYTRRENFFGKYKIVDWPTGFDPKTIPPPKYNVGEGIRFYDDYYKDSIGHGQITFIRLPYGGKVIESSIYKGISPTTLEEAIELYYLKAEPEYYLTWRGHITRVNQKDIIGV